LWKEKGWRVTIRIFGGKGKYGPAEICDYGEKKKGAIEEHQSQEG